MSVHNLQIPFSKVEIGERLNGANSEICNGKRSILKYWDSIIPDENETTIGADDVSVGDIVVIDWDGHSRVLITGKSSELISVTRVDDSNQASRRGEDSRLFTFEDFNQISNSHE